MPKPLDYRNRETDDARRPRNAFVTFLIIVARPALIGAVAGVPVAILWVLILGGLGIPELVTFCSLFGGVGLVVGLLHANVHYGGSGPA